MIGWIKNFTGRFADGLHFVGAPLVISATNTLAPARSLNQRTAIAQLD